MIELKYANDLSIYRIVKSIFRVYLSRDVIIHYTEDCENRVLMIKRSQK
jgi:hypothetical protein